MAGLKQFNEKEFKKSGTSSIPKEEKVLKSPFDESVYDSKYFFSK